MNLSHRKYRLDCSIAVFQCSAVPVLFTLYLILFARVDVWNCDMIMWRDAVAIIWLGILPTILSLIYIF